MQLDTNVTPNQGATTSSSSIYRGGPRVRAAAAEARQALLALASTRLGVQTGSLTVSKGVVSIDRLPTRSVTYGALLGDRPFNAKFTGTPPQKPISRYKLVGTRVPRVDIPAKASGTYVHMQHVLHGRVVRPPGQGANGDGAKPVNIDESSIAYIPTARVVRKGDFVGVLTEHEWNTITAARALKVTWQESSALPGNADLFDRMRSAKTTDTVIADWGDAPKAFAQAAHVASSTYCCPYQSHAPFAPNCASADVGPNGALVMSSTQDIYNSRQTLAQVLGLPVDKIRVRTSRPILRGFRHVRPQLSRGRRAIRRRHVTGGRQASARAIHALRRARLGQLWPGASRGFSCRQRCERKARGLRIPRLAAWLDRQRNHVRARFVDAAKGAHHRPPRDPCGKVLAQANMDQRFDIIIIGSGAGGGTLARHLAPSGKRILILERGDWLKREAKNWDAAAVFVDNRYVSPDTWYDRDGRPFQPQVHYFVGGATKMFGAALYRLRRQDFGELKHYDGVSPAWPISYEELEPYYAKAEEMYHVHGLRGHDPTDPPASGPYPCPPVSNEPRIAELFEQLKAAGYRPFPAPCAIMLNEPDMAYSTCIRCQTCDGFPCLVTPNPTRKSWPCVPRSNSPT